MVSFLAVHSTRLRTSAVDRLERYRHRLVGLGLPLNRLRATCSGVAWIFTRSSCLVGLGCRCGVAAVLSMALRSPPEDTTC